MFTKSEHSSNVESITQADGQSDSIMTVSEVAEFLRLHRSTVSRYAMSGELPSHKIGNRRLFKASDVWRFFDNQKVSSTQAVTDEMCSYSGKE